MSSPRPAYAAHPNTSPETERDVLAYVYAFVLRCGEVRRAEEMKKAARPGSPDDGEESKNASTATPQYNR